MVAEVVRIRDGTTQPSGGEPDQNLVEFLEEALERARSGEIIGMAGATMHPAPHGSLMPVSSFRAGWSCSVNIVGALEDIKFRLLRDLNNGD